MTKTLKALSLCCLLILAAACQKDFTIDNGAQLPAKNITTSVSGRVTDQTGIPVSGATVRAGSSFATTDINGKFQIENANLVDQAAFVRVEKPGYFNGSRTFVAQANQKHYAEIQLLTKNIAGSINGATGGSINLLNGSSISLPANSVVDESTGAAYSGMVQVSVAWIDPTSTELFRQMPGDLRGIDEAGRENNLQSFGMLAVELNGSSGQKLQIAKGKQASLKFPLPASVQAAAPATIPLWSFNETTGLWKQEGTATKSGNLYLAEVSHFSFWNCDAAFLNVNFSATFVDQNGKPLMNRLVKITRSGPSNGILLTTFAYTDTAGHVAGRVPQNEAMVLQVLGSYNCSQQLYTQNIGPYAPNTNANLGVVVVNTGVNINYTLTGAVNNCNGTPVASGMVNVVTGSGVYRADIINGNFLVSFPGCAASQSITYIATDYSGQQQGTSVTTTINAGNNNLGTITACGSNVNEFISFTFKGSTYTLTPPDSLMGETWSFQIPMTTVTGFTPFTSSYVNVSMTTRGQALGSFNLDNMDLTIGQNNYFDAITTGTTTFTEFGQVNQFISGTVSTMLKDSLSQTPYPFNCTFRVRRTR